MVKLIGWVFILLCPFMLGAFIPIVTKVALGWDIITVAIIYNVAWVILFSTWFDGSKYQDLI